MNSHFQFSGGGSFYHHMGSNRIFSLFEATFKKLWIWKKSAMNLFYQRNFVSGIEAEKVELMQMKREVQRIEGVGWIVAVVSIFLPIGLRWGKMFNMGTKIRLKWS